MPRYSLLIYTPVGGPPAGVDLAERGRRFLAFTEELKRDGVYLGGDRLHDADSATTVRIREGETQLTDGPFAETKEFLAGFYLLDCPDLDKALAYAARIPNADFASIEVRPIMEQQPAPA
ncbi:YciI family protein [Candidatus Solirubrobacter pratensis]|uniref:YciI family protein n=1 Tax=Candidatus Solirubrobacter pratensis TaxID=1298857 RepID=UPI00041A3812|nr:YciI family protein [Candidatus Solirubrobacter pratensis]